MTRSVRSLSLGLLVALVAGGCSREEGIEQYSVPKPWPIKVVVEKGEKSPRQRPMGPMAGASKIAGDRMFGAIVLRGDTAWFFKAAGSREALTPHAEKLIDVVRSVRFGADGTPTWTLPEGWTQKPGNEFRFATLVFGSGDSSLEMSVTKLPKNDADGPYILANVNRWRDQLGMPPTDAAGLQKESIEVPLADGVSALVVVLAADADRGTTAAQTEKPLVLKKYDTPAGWTDRGPMGERKASLAVVDGDKNLEITVTSFSASKPEMANPISNINRWRGQLGLAEATPEEIAGAAKETSVGGHRGVYVEMFAPDESNATRATFAAMFRGGGDVWFIKLSGDGALAKRERDNLKKFLESIRLEPQGATDGK